MLRSTLLVVALIVLTCTPLAAAEQRYEFLTGETICIEANQVVEQKVSAVFGGGQKLTSVSIRMNAVVLSMAPDKLLNETYYRDLAAFIKAHPDRTRLDSSAAFYELNVALQPPAELDSFRLRDRLMPGDGSMSIFVSNSIRDLGDDSPVAADRLADIFLPMCWSNEHGDRRCERRFPFLGFRVIGTILGVADMEFEAIGRPRPGSSQSSTRAPEGVPTPRTDAQPNPSLPGP